MKTVYNVLNAQGVCLNDSAFDSREEAENFLAEYNHTLFSESGLEVEEVKVKTWEDYMPSYVDLYYIDYRDDLSAQPKLLNECIAKNNFYPISEKLDEWWDFPEKYYLDEIRKEMINDDMEEEFDEHYDEIRDWLWEHDESDPVHDLIRNTSTLACYYDLGYDADGWHEAFLCNPWRNTSEAQEVANIRRKLGIKKGSKQDKQLESIVANACYGGNLRIYFTLDLENLVNCKEPKDDFKTIIFKGTFAVGIIDTVQGSGDFENIEIDCKFPFKRENIIVSACDHYSLEGIFGMYSDFTRNLDEPEFSYKNETRKRVRVSTAAAQLALQAEYDRVFKAGGCTCGDTDFKRHRDVYYKNEIPCGWHCPHCGQFWID